MTILSMILAVLPCLLICYLIFRLDKFEKEPWVPLIVSFVLGMASTYPARLIEGFAADMGFNHADTFGMLLFSAFIVVAFTEELLKFIMLMIYPYHQSSFNEPMDGIVYSVMIGMGFATVENLIYAYQFGIETTLLRAFTAVPAHAVFAVILGYYIGLAKFNREKPVQYIFLGLLLTVVVHGMYDFFIIQEYEDWLMILATLILVIGLFIARKFIITHQEISPFKDNLDEPSILGTQNDLDTQNDLQELKEEENEFLSAVLYEMKENQTAETQSKEGAKENLEIKKEKIKVKLNLELEIDQEEIRLNKSSEEEE